MAALPEAEAAEGAERELGSFTSGCCLRWTLSLSSCLSSRAHQATSNTFHRRAKNPRMVWKDLRDDPIPPCFTSPEPQKRIWQEPGMALWPFDSDTGKDRAQGTSRNTELHLCRNTWLHFIPTASLGLLKLQEKCKPHFPGLCSSPFFPLPSG